MGQIGQLLMPDLYGSFQQGVKDGQERTRRKTLAEYVQPALNGDKGALAQIYGVDPDAGMKMEQNAQQHAQQSKQFADEDLARLAKHARMVTALADSGDMQGAQSLYETIYPEAASKLGADLPKQLNPQILAHMKSMSDAMDPQKQQPLMSIGNGTVFDPNKREVVYKGEPQLPGSIQELAYLKEHPELAAFQRQQYGAMHPRQAASGGGGNGRAPAGYRYKQDGSLEPIPGGPADDKTRAPAVPGDQALTGDAYIKTLDPQTAAQVRALADGRMAFPTGTALKSPHWQGMLGAVSQYDPSFDAINYNARSGTRKGFTSGKEAQTVNSLNTVAEHLGTLSDYIQKLNNTSYPAINRVKNFFAAETGDPDIARFNTAKKAVADEVAKVWRSSGGSEADIQENLRNLDGAQSPEQLNAAVATLTKLISGKVAALNDQYTQGMGKAQDVKPLVSPEAQSAYDKVLKRGGEQGGGEQYKVGQVITVGGKQYKVTGGDPSDPELEAL